MDPLIVEMTKADSMDADCCQCALAFVRGKPLVGREMSKPVVLSRRVWTSPSLRN
ncbi:hypothetical protein PF005_g2469 [Phytophthora fragariae]|uniref:Uncharacterized protein n=1 Tax=Phytophthora fragariae TaxID=53985 RepID=A0A6A3ZN05_9STRA|nr:hypothetical protein PF003_g36539 [Phytophthora fragariae]KAE8940244.1 hypothetical protein PF009_g9941 [Phytophthora fragariae]KAE9011754.1 hypothetical protein PF011_g9230 [Phytophthora fragariae]KAE9117269.1 hypothetical protein PF007_g9348 [Phytophthora fragariae]KAE9117472.1 hypothetical protein PF010_g8591 [Phytophthora fragariae]